MVAILGCMLVFALVVIAGLWATVRTQREELEERDARIAAMIDYVPPRAVQFVVDTAGVFGADELERATEPGDPPAFDLKSMADNRPTLT